MGEVKVFFGFLAGWRDLSRALIFSTCSRFISFAYLTCGRLIKLRVLISYAFYKVTAFGLDCLFWDGSFVPAATVGFAFSFIGFALTAIGSIVLVDNGVG